ncbi:MULTISPECIES: BON domain-containing protein [Paraburkholderia]|uniref:BON domain-containing protein n=1 Tax=Paraburkholderia TaxID=1822464 RepID=UPI00224DC7D2|nr:MULTISPECIES: BON domain-containing protein [Paraburkholderia]MCX4170841.1 BON domain-containing protein [Paraburkholderia madseniana]MDQ6458853.1 BON domain-containing protein [Paraburkholderia madseniana]
MKTKNTASIVIGMVIGIATVSANAQGGPGSETMSTAKSASQVASSKSGDRALQKRVRAAFAKSKDVTASNITVRAHGGAVILQGTVPDQDEIESAAEVAKGVPGVTSVKNALTVRAAGQ